METRGAGLFAGSDDETLVFHIREGNTEALRELSARYVAVAKKIARSHLRHPQEDWKGLLANSIYQCVVRGKFDRNIGPLRPYLVETIRNEARSMRRSERTYHEHNRSYEDCVECGVPVEAFAAARAHDELGLAEHLCIIEKVIEEWENASTHRRQKQRWAFILRRIMAGRSVAEIASELGTDAKSVHNALVKHIRPQIRKALGNGPDGNPSAQC